MKIYCVGSLRKSAAEDLGRRLRDAGHEVFTMYRAAGPNADDEARDYFKRNGMRYSDYLKSSFARHIVDYDLANLEWADVVVTAGAPGTSSAYELQWAGERGKRAIIYLEQDPERWDAMALLVPGLEVYETFNELAVALMNSRPGLNVVRRTET